MWETRYLIISFVLKSNKKDLWQLKKEKTTKIAFLIDLIDNK